MEKVLIVDNDLDSLDTLERVLRKEFKIFRAGNGFEAIHVLDREGEMALVISELSMPVVDGVEFLMGIMHAYPETIRVVLTRSLDPDLLLAAVNDLKLFRYMVKPFNREELLLVVRQGAGLYRLGKGQKMNVPPVGVLQFPAPPPEYLTIEIDQDQCQAQVEALVSSSFFQALSQETDATPPPESSSEYFTFLDDYQTPDIALDFLLSDVAISPNDPSPNIDQNEDENEDTIFLIREFVSHRKDSIPEIEDPNTVIQNVALEPIDRDQTSIQREGGFVFPAIEGVETVIQTLYLEPNLEEPNIEPIDGDQTTPQENTSFLIGDFVKKVNQTEPATKPIDLEETIVPAEQDSFIPDLANPEDQNDRSGLKKPMSQGKDPKPPKEKKHSPHEKNDPEAHLIAEIDTLIQKLEEQENPQAKPNKIPSKNSDNPLDSPEFRELQRQSNALIARIIRSWG